MIRAAAPDSALETGPPPADAARLTRARLARPGPALMASHLEALAEGHARGIDAPLPADRIREIAADPAAYLAEKAPKPGGTTLTAPNGREIETVPDETLWLCDGPIFIGEFSLRLALSEVLARFGGHVGYGIRPRLQERGFATRGLALALTRLRETHGLEKVLVTCAPDHRASARVIEKNGGVSDGVHDNDFGFPAVTHYWIYLTSQDEATNA